MRIWIDPTKATWISPSAIIKLRIPWMTFQVFIFTAIKQSVLVILAATQIGLNGIQVSLILTQYLSWWSQVSFVPGSTDETRNDATVFGPREANLTVECCALGLGEAERPGGRPEQQHQGSQDVTDRPGRFGARLRHGPHGRALPRGQQHQPIAAGSGQLHQRAGRRPAPRALPRLEIDTPAAGLARRQLQDGHDRRRLALVLLVRGHVQHTQIRRPSQKHQVKRASSLLIRSSSSSVHLFLTTRLQHRLFSALWWEAWGHHWLANLLLVSSFTWCLFFNRLFPNSLLSGFPIVGTELAGMSCRTW